MSSLLITGLGLNTELVSSFDCLIKKGIKNFPTIREKNSCDDYFEKEISFQSARLIDREDRSILNNCAKLAIDAAYEAFTMAQLDKVYTLEEKNDFPIFIANESAENNFSAVEKFVKKYTDVEDNILWDELGKIKDLLHPIDMLRLLSTNPLYHVSKVLKLHGGGYPISRASLSGLTALDEAVCTIPQRYKRALVLAVGDLKIPENLCAFSKMSLLRTVNNKNGIIPSFASAALIIESNNKNDSIRRSAFAEIISIKSVYKTENRISHHDWLALYSTIPILDKNKLTIVSYDNGVNDLAEEEHKAIKIFCPEAQLMNYKKYYGYTGKANNLVDLVTALSDKRIPIGNYILLNGIGMSVGFGYMLIKKVAQVGEPNAEKTN